MEHNHLTKRQLKALETKEALYQAAIKLFTEKGYENVVVEEITALANTAKGTFYNHFPSKKDVLYHTFQKFDDIYREAYEATQALTTFKDRLLTFIDFAYKKIDALGKKIPWALYHNSMLDSSPLILSNNRTLYQIIYQFVDEAIQAGELSSHYDTAYYVDLIKTQLVGIDYRWCVSSDIDHFSQFAVKNIACFLNGLMHT